MLIGAALAVLTWTGDSPDWRFRLAMSLVIAGIGAALFWLGPEAAPNTGRPDWAQGVARAETRTQARTMGLAGVICLLFSVPIAMQLPDELAKGNDAAWVALVFPLVGISLAFGAVLRVLRDRKFRDARFEMQPAPGVAGGRLGGRIVVGYAFPPGTPVELTLSCVHSYSSRQDRDRTRWQRVLWQDEATAVAVTDGVASYVPVEFAIPYDARETDCSDPLDEILWRLAARARVSGLDFETTFTAPVLRTAESDAGLTIARLDAERQRRAVPPASAQAGETRLYLAPARQKSAAAMLTLFGLLSVGSGAFFGYLLRQWLGWFGFLLPFVPIGGIGLLLLAIACSMWFRSSTIEVANGEVRVRTSWFGVARSRVVRAGEVERIELRSGMQRGDEVWYDLRLHLKPRGRVTAGDSMTRKEADWLAAEVRRELGVAG
jgi:hypothetical protein